MEATDILMDEHRLIERVITVLERAVGRLEAGEVLRPGLFLEACDFIKNFADGIHHMKEEGILFATMQTHGVPVEGGPLGVMLAEHEQGRAYTREMKAAAQEMAAGDQSVQPALVQAARGYAALLRQHILKEDRILFPIADRAIPPELHVQVLADFKELENNEIGTGLYDKYQALVKSLEAEIR